MLWLNLDRPDPGAYKRSQHGINPTPLWRAQLGEVWKATSLSERRALYVLRRPAEWFSEWFEALSALVCSMNQQMGLGGEVCARHLGMVSVGAFQERRLNTDHGGVDEDRAPVHGIR